MSYIGNSPETNAAVNKYEYTITLDDAISAVKVQFPKS
jgi:hypothetical protein